MPPLRARLYVRALNPIRANGEDDAWAQSKCTLEGGSLTVFFKDGSTLALPASSWDGQNAVATNLTVRAGVPARRFFVITVGQHEIAASSKAEAETWSSALANGGDPPEGAAPSSPAPPPPPPPPELHPRAGRHRSPERSSTSQPRPLRTRRSRAGPP